MHHLGEAVISDPSIPYEQQLQSVESNSLMATQMIIIIPCTNGNPNIEAVVWPASSSTGG
jgi:hypothetical protein